ncbi:gliding motility-associated C-terminal domain-containing protein [Lewinella sp. LCG006]|uniref:gliding motility-associated C-terminal domain-containing protein n=1 Tax=Lewinella sp. LCG006 TaxID=3231911 RepID=UPI00345F4CDB
MRLFLCCCILLYFGSLGAQQFQNPDLEGVVEFDVASGLPPGWQAVPASAPFCAATALGITDTPDLTDPLGPVPDVGMMGNPYSGNTFMSGLSSRQNDIPFARFHEGIMQTVSGFTVDSFYQLSFYQAVVKQINALDTSGRWAVYRDNSQLFISPTSRSAAAYNALDFPWDFRSFEFKATSETHTFAFMPQDDDSILYMNDELNGGLRMGIDAIYLNKSCMLTDDLGPPLYFCQEDEINVVLDVLTSEGSYVWSTGETGPAITATQPGTYQVTITGADGCVNYDQVNIIRNELNLDLGADTTICSGETIVLSAVTSGAFYTWQDGSSSTTFSVTDPGLYWAEIRVGECRARDSVLIVENPVATINLGPDVEWCAGDSIVVSANPQLPGVDYEWQDGSTESSFLVTNAPAEITLLANLDGCTHADTLQVTPTFLPFSLGADTTLCTGDSLLLDASLPNTSYLWQDGTTTPTFLATSGGVYTVALSRDDCTITDTLQITELSFGALDLGADTTLCPGNSLTLAADIPGANYVWQDQSTGADFTLSAPGLYWVTASVGDCAATDSILVSPHPLNPVDLGEALAICAESTLLLDATQNGASYSWQDGSSAPTYEVATSGNYSVTVTLGACSSSETVQVVNSLLQPFNLGPDLTLCQGETLTLTGPSVAEYYLWSNGANTQSINVGTAGTYRLTATLGECTEEEELVLNYNPLAPFSLGVDTTLCLGDSLLLIAENTAAEILWSDGTTGNTLWINTPGNYGLTLTLDDCTQNSSLEVTYYEATSLELGQNITICESQPLVLDPLVSGPPPTFLWQDGTSTATYEVQNSGTYTLMLTNICETATDEISVTIEDCTCEVYLPNAFSPNGDGTNDTFCSYTTCPITDYDLQIFDRWGGLRYTSNNMEEGWQGLEVNSGVYLYTLRYRDRDGKWQQRVGEVHLLR